MAHIAYWGSYYNRSKGKGLEMSERLPPRRTGQGKGSKAREDHRGATS